MRILHISKYDSPYIGGVENICKYIADNSQNHEVAILCFNDGKKNVIEEFDGVKVYRVGNWLNVARQANTCNCRQRTNAGHIRLWHGMLNK